MLKSSLTATATAVVITTTTTTTAITATADVIITVAVCITRRVCSAGLPHIPTRTAGRRYGSVKPARTPRTSGRVLAAKRGKTTEIQSKTEPYSRNVGLHRKNMFGKLTCSHTREALMILISRNARKNFLDTPATRNRPLVFYFLNCSLSFDLMPLVHALTEIRRKKN